MARVLVFGLMDFFLLGILITSHLSVLKLINQFFLQIWSVSKSSCYSLMMSASLLVIIHSRQLSPKSRDVELTSLRRTLMYTTKGIIYVPAQYLEGPRMWPGLALTTVHPPLIVDYGWYRSSRITST